MEPWAWIVVYLVGFTLFQLLLFRFVSDAGTLDGLSLGSGETTDPRSVDHTPPTREPDRGPERTGEGVRCPHCGTDNEDEEGFTYCRNCLAQLR